MADELTAAGLIIDDLETRRLALESELRASISPLIDVGSDSPEGQISLPILERIQSLAELIQAVYANQYPAGASGQSLTALARLTGTERRSATKSQVECSINIDAGTYLAGTLVAHVSGDPDSRFVSKDDVTNPGPGAGDFDVDFEAETAGVVQAFSGTLTVIAEPVVGWNSVTNAEDAEEGTATETDTQLRGRRQDELQTGSTSTGAILTAITQIEGVIWAAVLENSSDDTSPEGWPPHSIIPVIHAPTVTDELIAQVIGGNSVYPGAKAAGIQSYGDTDVFVDDSQGNQQTIGITRAMVTDVHIEVTLEVDDEIYDGDDEAETVLADWGDETIGVGDDLIISHIIHQIIDNVTGVIDVTEVLVDTVSPPAQTTNLEADFDELFDLDTSRITVNS